MRLPAFWTGLLYDDAALDAAWTLVKDWTAEERQALRKAVPRTARSRRRSGAARCWTSRAMRCASQAGGLKARARLNAYGRDERVFLEPLDAIVTSGRSTAEDLLSHYANEWKGDIDRIYLEHAFCT